MKFLYKKIALFFIITIAFQNLHATTWHVGSTQNYNLPSEVMPLVNDGDTILIDADEYLGDVGAWTKNNLVIMGVGGIPHLRADGNYAWQKGIWVFAGDNITVENIEFSEASVPDMNGAGIRLDGVGITVRNCYFHDNENGILTSNNGGDILVENSEFNHNGYGDGFSHGIYVGHVDNFTLKNCYMHHAYVGHNVKSRAQNNYILYNRIMDENDGESSSLLDLPNGGFSIVLGNLFMQSEVTQNGRLISFGVEGLTNTVNELYAVNNTLVNERPNGARFFQIEDGTPVVKIINNLLVGNGDLVQGNVTPELITNLQILDIANHPFVDYNNFDYRLFQNTSPTNAGSVPGIAGNFSLTPTEEYFHPLGAITRNSNGSIDIGAYEFQLNCTSYFVSNSGSDSNAGLSLNDAFLTLQHAADIVETGDSVFVENGIYVGFDLRDRSGTADKPIVFTALGNNVLINQSGPIRDDGINIENANFIVIDGFISNDMTGNGNGIRLVLADNCVVKNCSCDNNAERGIFTGFTDDILIENNICSNSIDEHGIYVSNSSDRPIIRYNECFGNNNIGIHMNGDLSIGGDGIISDAQVYGNIIHDNNLAAGINMDGVENPIIYNNLIYNNHFAQGIALFQQDGAIVTSGAKIFNNTIIVPDDGRWGILMKNGANVNTEIYNNIIINQHAWRGCIAVESTAQLTSDYNILNDKMSDDGDGSAIDLMAWQALGFDGNSQLANPLTTIFADAASDNYQLILGSQAIDVGTDLVNSTVMNDLIGNARPNGTTYDIGAYEFISSVGISKINADLDYTLFPNPFSESAVLILEKNSSKADWIKIYNTHGQFVKKCFFDENNKVEILRKGMTNGLYCFYIFNEEEVVGTGKFICH